MSGLTVVFADRPTLSDEARERILSIGTDDDRDEVSQMLESAALAARPGFAFRRVPVEKAEGGVALGGVLFSNPLVSGRLAPVAECYPCVVTCGKELEEWSLAYRSDPLSQYRADEIKRAYLACASRAFSERLRSLIPPPAHAASLNPGSLKEWPLAAQQDLFALLGREEISSRLGVTLTPSMLMLPSKSVSGIWFESTVSYENCMYCPRTDCPGRRAPFRPGEAPV